MGVLEHISTALSSIRANKMRSFLTTLGIVIGIASVVSVSAIANGGKKQIEKSFEQFGTNRLIIHMNWEKRDEIKFRDYFTRDDLETLQGLGEEITALSPLYGGSWISLSKDGKRVDIVLYGVNEQGAEIDNVKMLSGRFISRRDVLAKRKVIVINEKDARELFGTADVLGETVAANTWRGPMELTIIGVTKYEGNIMDQFTNGGRCASYIPISTIMGGNDRYYAFSIKVKEKEKMEQVSRKVIMLLEKKHHNKDVYVAFNLQQLLDSVIRQMSMIALVLALVAAITLMVGGIGIMNIMLVSVTERTREIGIRKAVGAKQRVIMCQFLTEAVIISLIGGAIGIILGIFLASSLSYLLKLPPFISPADILIAVTFSVFVGIVFGVYPASKASKLDPIVALRYE